MSTVNPVEYNQQCINQYGLIHEQCMDTLLDADSTLYEMWSQQRRHMATICKASAQAARAFDQHINRFNTHTLPIKEYIERKRAAATITF